MTIEEIQVLITANSNELYKEIGRVQGKLTELENATAKTSNKMTSIFKGLRNGIVALGIGTLLTKTIKSALDYIGGDTMYQATMGEWKDATRDFTEDLKAKLGISRSEMRRFIADTYSITRAMGIGGDASYKMAKSMAMLSQDMAQFRNISPEEALQKLQSGLTGNAMALKQVGILVNEATIKQVAYANGIAKTGAELTEQQKVYARYVAIMQQTGQMQGYLASTLETPNAQLRILKDSLRTLSQDFGQLFIPVLQAVLPYLNAFVKLMIQAVSVVANFFGIAIGSKLTEGMVKASDGAGGITNNLEKADKKAKKLKNTLAGFDEMNVLQEPTDSSGGGAGGLGAGGLSNFDIPEYDFSWLDGMDSKVDKIVKSIKDKFTKMGDVLKKVWNSDPVQAFVGTVGKAGGFLYDYWVGLGTSLVQNSIETWDGVKGSIFNALGNITTLWTTFWTDLGVGIDTWGKPIIEGVVGLFDSIWNDAFDPYIKIYAKVWEDFSKILLDIWKKYGKPLIDNIGEYVTNIIALFQKIWDKVIDPIITPLLETFSWLWDKHLKAVVQEVGEFIMKLVNGALEIWNKFLQPIIVGLLDKLAPAFAFISNFIIGVVGTFIGFIADGVKGILKILGGLIDFIVGVFTGDWKKVWNGLVSIFKGIVDGLVAIIKLPINLIIDVINSFIAGLNKIQIPDWVPAVGGKGLNIPKIQKLARGGIVDRPTNVIIGDAGREVVMPLERNTGWIDTLATRIGSLISGNTDPQPIHVTVKFGEDTVLQRIIDGINKKAYELNEEVILV